MDTHENGRELDIEGVVRLSKDLREAARTLSDKEVRFLVDAYYSMQGNRIVQDNRRRAMEGEPHVVLDWFSINARFMENQVKAALDRYSLNHPMGEWTRAVYGIGPVISAGLLAHIYIGEWCQVCRGRNPDHCKANQADKKRKLPEHEFQPVISCPTVGHIWRFAGLDPTLKWRKGQKRPYNASLKVLCWKTGESFKKFSANEQCVYGHIYLARKRQEEERNEAGLNEAQADADLAQRGPTMTPEQRAYYQAGKFPPGRLDLRASRYAVKQFLSDLHAAWYRHEFGTEPPLPYPIAILGHAHHRRP